MENKIVSLSPPEITTEDRIKEKQATIIIARDRTRLELNGLENQLYILDQILNPPSPEPETPPDTGTPMEEGTV